MCYSSVCCVVQELYCIEALGHFSQHSIRAGVVAEHEGGLPYPSSVATIDEGQASAPGTIRAHV
jgi:hypothetical protein